MRTDDVGAQHAAVGKAQGGVRFLGGRGGWSGGRRRTATSSCG
jgi:hypothetical protein